MYQNEMCYCHYAARPFDKSTLPGSRLVAARQDQLIASALVLRSAEPLPQTSCIKHLKECDTSQYSAKLLAACLFQAGFVLRL